MPQANRPGQDKVPERQKLPRLCRHKAREAGDKRCTEIFVEGRWIERNNGRCVASRQSPYSVYCKFLS